MNPDFKLIPGTAKVPIKGKKGEFIVEATLRLTYKDVGLARWQGDEAGIKQAADEYLKTHGHLAEWRRRWQCQEFEPGTNWVSWDDSMLVAL